MDFVSTERVAWLRVVAPVIGGLIFIGATGFLHIRSEAVQTGLMIDWDNSPSAVTDPASPWLQQLAIAVLCGLAVFGVWPRSAPHQGVWAAVPAAVFAATLVVVSAWFLVTTSYPHRGPVDSAFGSGGTNTALHTPSSDPALLEWGRAGALDSATHALAGVAIALVIMGILRAKAQARSAASR